MVWNKAANEAFTKLKIGFTTGAFFKHTDPSKAFIVEGFFSDKPKLHMMPFFSRKLSPAEQNYNIGNHETLTVKLALKDWHH